MKEISVEVYEGKIRVGYVMDYLATSAEYYDPNGTLRNAMIPLDAFYKNKQVRDYFFERFAEELKNKLAN